MASWNRTRMIFFSILFISGSCMAHESGSYEQHVEVASPCTDEIRQRNCFLPTCRCSGSDIPGKGQTNANTPQLVFLTFDDAITFANYAFYEEILLNSNRRNPNGHSITATFFVNHEYTNYSMVHELWRYGHEIALHSVTHRGPPSYWGKLSEELWHAEIVQQRDQMAEFAQIPISDIKGMRAPFLQAGGDRMYKILKQANFLWESSRPTIDFRKPGLWPYTNDYLSHQECQIAPCPVGRYAGFWTVPMLSLLARNKRECSMADMCYPMTAAETFNLLHDNFQDHYKGNRAPFGLFIHSAWVHGPDTEDTRERRSGYTRFLDYLATLDDVYMVSISRALEWIKHPTPLPKLDEFTPFQVDIKKSQCPRSTSCRFGPQQTPFPTQTERYMHSCVATCPNSYPWLGDVLGRGKTT